MNGELLKWKGSALIQQGIGMFIGQSGHNDEHSHWAHQISFSLENDVTVSSGSTEFKGRAIFIPANAPHLLHPGPTLTLYVDPNLDLIKSIIADIRSDTAICQLHETSEKQIISCFNNAETLARGLKSLQDISSHSNQNKKDIRLSKVQTRLDQITQGQDVSRDELLALVNLSPSRFSHWFKEQTGMPLRSYKRWLHLVHGVDAILNGANVQSAAYDASFSDQAHFCRTFKQAFGLSPKFALSHITLD